MTDIEQRVTSGNFPKEIVQNVDKSLCTKDIHQCMTSKGKNLEIPRCPTMGELSRKLWFSVCSEYSHYVGKCSKKKAKQGIEREPTLYTLQGFQQWGNMSNCQHYCGNWVFPEFCNFFFVVFYKRHRKDSGLLLKIRWKVQMFAKYLFCARQTETAVIPFGLIIILPDSLEVN